MSVIGSKVYGSSDLGVFSMNTDGSAFQLLGVPAATAPLMAIGSTIFGLRTPTGGGQSTLFSMNLDGTGLLTRHTFAGGANDGAGALGNMVVFNGDIYGVTSLGGTSNRGTLWTIHPDGTGFQILHSFAGGTSDGNSPIGGLLLLGSTLYGQTLGGGTGSQGTIYSLAVPEPSSFLLVATAFFAICLVRRRLRR